ncbi:hypothetical protein [Sphingobium lignivorans]|uniref:Uncharacterized protein n=1 Tax=Sphingobium lignivorans TaxID=2735886 RepID=A0ABR6NDY4_9SPHN|nr:hypothetical protein [Sphingobium lignivorans]MBB5985485.1 hypothetical protein [Sphingobium lignivorans]
MDAVGPDIVSLAKLFPHAGTHELMARLRNGDLDAGVEDCAFQYRWNRERWRQRQIEHAQLRHADTLVAQAETYLLDRDCDPKTREILLHLAGSIADPRLLPALLQSWALDEGRLDRLEDYLWAFAFCCSEENAEQALSPVCDAWAALPTTRNGSDPSPRDDLASSEMRWAIERRPPGPAIDYLTRRGASEDLAWPIYYLLHAVDHPAALRFCVTEMGKARARSAQSYFINFRGGRDHWERRRDENGLLMSSANRALLLDWWQDPGGDPNERTAAFDLWASSWGESDLGIMRASQDDAILGDRILQRRLERGDDTAIPLLLPKLERDDRRFWWQYTRTVWSEELTHVLRTAFANRAAEIAPDPDRDFEIDHVLFNAVIRLPRDLAEQLLLEHWGDASGSPQLVQAALYIETDALLDRAAEAIAKAEEPSKLFQYLTSHFGIKERGHPGLTRIGQIEALAPYFGLIEKESELNWLADGCNDRGWFDLRRRLLDPHLPHSRHCWSEDRLPGLFDQLARDPRRAPWDIEAVLGAGLEWDQIAACLRTWLTTDPPKDAMYAACAILEEHGRRCDLSMLSKWPGTPDESISATTANATFKVQHRTAD